MRRANPKHQTKEHTTIRTTPVTTIPTHLISTQIDHSCFAKGEVVRTHPDLFSKALHGARSTPQQHNISFANGTRVLRIIQKVLPT